MRTRRALVLLAGATLVVGMGACATDDDPPATDGTTGAANEETYTIGVANFMLSGPYFVGMDRAVAAQAEEMGVTVISTDAGGDAAKLASNVDDLLSQEVDGIIISGGPLGSAPAALNAIDAAGTPVVLVDRLFDDDSPYTAWIGPDNTALGTQNGEFIVDQLDGQGKVAMIKGGPADNSIGLARSDGARSVLSSESGITLVEAPDFGDWATDGGMRVMESLLAQHGDITAVFCENDAMCLGAQKAADDAGRTDEMFFVGIDGQTEAVKAIMDGTNYLATGLNNADTIGRLGLDRMLEILGGESFQKDTVVPSPQVTVDNAAEFYNPDGTF